MNATHLSTMVAAYLECAEWSSIYGPEGKPCDELCLAWSDEAEARALADCTAFFEANAADLAAMDAAQAGHDFWLTRNHHGVGFWDRGLGALGRRLTDAAHAEGPCDVDSDETSEFLELL